MFERFNVIHQPLLSKKEYFFSKWQHKLVAGILILMMIVSLISGILEFILVVYLLSIPLFVFGFFVNYNMYEKQYTLYSAISAKTGWVFGKTVPTVTSLLDKTYTVLPYGTPEVTSELSGEYKPGKQFYRCMYSATTGYGKNRRTIYANVLLFKLQKKIPFRFSMVREQIFHRAKDDLNVESIEFNKLFKFHFEQADKQNLAKMITPHVQTVLLDLHKEYKLKGLEVVEDTLLITTAKYPFVYDRGLFRMTPPDEDDAIIAQANHFLSFVSPVSDVFGK